MFLLYITNKIVLFLRDNLILGADSDIIGKDLIRKRIMTASMHVTVKMIIISNKINFDFYHILHRLYFYKTKLSSEKETFVTNAENLIRGQIRKAKSKSLFKKISLWFASSKARSLTKIYSI
jgi:hypothetical protein